MAGTNQHYILQSLLLAFGKQGKGKEVQVAVYKGRKIGPFKSDAQGKSLGSQFFHGGKC
jgi:hypothetical protein